MNKLLTHTLMLPTELELSDHNHYRVDDLVRYASARTISVRLHDETIKKVRGCHDYLYSKINDTAVSYYGINTGFGQLCNVAIPEEELSELQFNLIRSHACGAGREIPSGIVRLIVLTKIISLSKGHSGVAVETVELLMQLLKHDILPVIYEQGSLGASGDLAPLAHLGLVLLGEGEVMYRGNKMPTVKAFDSTSLTPIIPKAKEGLAILNGTQFMLAYGIYVTGKSKQLVDMIHKISALSSIAFSADKQPYSALIHAIRPSRPVRNGKDYVWISE